MKKRNCPRYASASGEAAERTPTTWLYVLLTVVCAGILAVGFFFAARQHFASMELGMKNSKLRKQIEEMEAQNRQLVLAREIVRSPAEVKRIAATKGFREKDLEFATANIPAASLPSNPLIQKTATVSPTNNASTDKKAVKTFLPADKQDAAVKKEAKPKTGSDKRSKIDSNMIAMLRIRQ